MSSGDTIIARGGELYELLSDRFPAFRSKQGVLDIPRMAKEMEVSHETLYRAVRGQRAKGYPNGRLTVEIAVRVLELSRTSKDAIPLYAEDLLPYLLPHFAFYKDETRALLA